MDDWLGRLERGPVHRCAAIFVDNSGLDVILGVVPFARELVQRGTKVGGALFIAVSRQLSGAPSWPPRG